MGNMNWRDMKKKNEKEDGLEEGEEMEKERRWRKRIGDGETGGEEMEKKKGGDGGEGVRLRRPTRGD